MAGFFCSSYFSLFFLKVTVYFFFCCFENINNEYQSLVTALQTTCIKPASLEGNVRTGLFNPRKFLQRVSHFSTCSAYIAIKKKKKEQPNQTKNHTAWDISIFPFMRHFFAFGN